MNLSSPETISAELARLDARDENYATRFVERLLSAARERGVSDVHLLPTPQGLELRWRVDGVLQPLGTFPRGTGADVVTRLKVLADLLTYRTDVPQEGRIRDTTGVEVRVSTLPSLYGEKAVVRLFSSGDRFLRIEDLGFPADVQQALGDLLGETSGAMLVTGPAGSGKTTTLYACLRELAARSGGGRSIVTLEDPIEVSIPGVTQSQVSAAAGFDFAAGLRSVVRQDPEVIMVGEVRDQITAEVALQASLTGQLVVSSFHAGSAAGAVSRLLDMGIEPYVLLSGLLAILSQRLVRKLCECAAPAPDSAKKLGFEVPNAHIPVGCPRCGGTGYRGRLVLVEMLQFRTPELQQAVLARADRETIGKLATSSGMISLSRRAIEAIDAGLTSAAEVRRVLGLGFEGH